MGAPQIGGARGSSKLFARRHRIQVVHLVEAQDANFPAGDVDLVKTAGALLDAPKG